MRYSVLILATLVLIGAGCGRSSAKNQAQNNGQQSNNTMNTNAGSVVRKSYKAPFAMQIDTTKSYTAVLHTTAGDITIELSDDSTPNTVNNFVSLARDQFYNNTIFHRVIRGFMVQGGDPAGDGTGGPGYRFDNEAFAGEYTRGTIAMANAGPNTNGSQFFIMHADVPLPKDYVIFGKVKSGLDVVDAIANSPVEMSATGEMSSPRNPVFVQSVDILEE